MNYVEDLFLKCNVNNAWNIAVVKHYILARLCNQPNDCCLCDWLFCGSVQWEVKKSMWSMGNVGLLKAW